MKRGESLRGKPVNSVSGIILVILVVLSACLPGGVKERPLLWRGQPALMEKWFGIPDDAIRFRIIANSDASDDQSVKEAVRDAVLPILETQARQAAGTADAVRRIRPSLPKITQIANTVIAQRGKTYHAHVVFGIVHFPEKQWDGRTYPEGDYPALRIVLGTGNGHNFWCVLYPALCPDDTAGTISNAHPAPARPLATLHVKTGDGQSMQTVQVRLAFLDWLMEWFQKLFASAGRGEASPQPGHHRFTVRMPDSG
jgi:stage II sporulation protein R